ncbi:hypothetical protein ABIB94_005945, partial [Bradyrhizobium sp. JR7.2]
MRAEQEHLDGLPERQLADRLMSIAESRSVRALGIACCSAITELTGSPTVGLYLLDGLEPELVYSRHVAEGLLDNYRAGFWKRDPVLDCIMTQGRAVDGETVIGPQQWRHSPSFEMLHEWGFAYKADSNGRRNTRRLEVAMNVVRRRSARSGRAALPSPGRPSVAGRDEQNRFWLAIAAGLSSEDA